jgi:hypothetical protein
MPDDATAGKPSASVFETLAALIGLVVGVGSGARVWQRLWDWNFRGEVQQGAESVWNQEPFHAIVLALLTGVETLLIGMVVALVCYGVVLGLLRAGRAIGKAFMVGFRS